MSQANPMMEPRISKVCVNIGVGEGGDRLVNAENVLEMVTGVKPQRTLAALVWPSIVTARRVTVDCAPLS